MQYTDDILLNCTLETFDFITDATPIILIKNYIGRKIKLLWTAKHFNKHIFHFEVKIYLRKKIFPHTQISQCYEILSPFVRLNTQKGTKVLRNTSYNQSEEDARRWGSESERKCWSLGLGEGWHWVGAGVNMGRSSWIAK
uniref:Uncharacterized protein n=1 Tax=Rousettus aegyptiacus TaxID=9407 RepID=A0A7J8EJX4_ROUAE|nr:hypothetical protein HJG63_012490 [Rousettus aegyptiacus]